MAEKKLYCVAFSLNCMPTRYVWAHKKPKKADMLKWFRKHIKASEVELFIDKQ